MIEQATCFVRLLIGGHCHSGYGLLVLVEKRGSREWALRLLRDGSGHGITEWNEWRHQGGETPELGQANLSNADLSGADLSRADMSESDLSGTNLSWANLIQANLSRTNLSRANLSRANLRGADLSDANMRSARLSVHTFEVSRWTPHRVAAVLGRGAIVDHPGEFAKEVHQAPLSDRQGLMALRFNAHLTAFDRYLLAGVIFDVLGDGTECNMELFEEDGGGAIIRFLAPSAKDLERVADALWDRVWETTEGHQAHAFAKAVPGLLPALGEMRLKLDSIELRQLAHGELPKSIESGRPQDETVEHHTHEGRTGLAVSWQPAPGGSTLRYG